MTHIHEINQPQDRGGGGGGASVASKSDKICCGPMIENSVTPLTKIITQIQLRQ